jgi:ATP/ADP translocase
MYLVLSGVSAVICALLLVLLDLRSRTAAILVFAVVGFIASAAWYVLSYRWIDRYGSWTDLAR